MVTNRLPVLLTERPLWLTVGSVRVTDNWFPGFALLISSVMVIPDGKLFLVKGLSWLRA